MNLQLVYSGNWPTGLCTSVFWNMGAPGTGDPRTSQENQVDSNAIVKPEGRGQAIDFICGSYRKSKNAIINRTRKHSQNQG